MVRRIALVCLLELITGVAALSLELPQGTALLDYHVGEEAISIAVFVGGKLQTVSLVPLPRDRLVEKVEAFREALSSPPDPQEETSAELEARALGKELYDLLIAPVEDYIRAVTHLVIVPSDVLFYVPFGALFRCPDCQGKRELWGGEYLIQRYSISYLPSLLAPSGEGKRTAYGSILILSPPPSFPFAAQEIEEISSFFPESHIAPDLEGFKERLKKGEDVVVHIPYGCFWIKPYSPWESGFSLDGTLWIADLAEAGMKSDLLVFSGCLCGGMRPGFGVAVEGLLASGIRSILLPLWGTSTTSPLTVEFYRGLFEGLPKGEALRQAQLALLQIHHHPHFWAQFLLYGDWRGGAVETGKIAYTLYLKLLSWKANPTAEPPSVEILLILERPAEEGDLELLKGFSDELEILAAYGSFIVLRVPISLLEELASLPQISSITEVPETIP